MDKILVSYSEEVDYSWSNYHSNYPDKLKLYLLYIMGRTSSVSKYSIIEKNDTDYLNQLNTGGVLIIKIKNKNYILILFTEKPSIASQTYFYRIYDIESSKLVYDRSSEPTGKIEDQNNAGIAIKRPIIMDMDNNQTHEILLFSEGVGFYYFKIITFVD